VGTHDLVELGDELRRDGTIVETTPVREPTGDRLPELGLFGGRRLEAAHLDPRQVTRVGGVWEEGHDAGSAKRPRANASELDSGPTSDVKLTAVSVDDRELAFPVGEDIDEGLGV
jgi:hypothetical protein